MHLLLLHPPFGRVDGEALRAVGEGTLRERVENGKVRRTGGESSLLAVLSLLLLLSFQLSSAVLLSRSGPSPEARKASLPTLPKGG
jgi:hypothetical protein